MNKNSKHHDHGLRHWVPNIKLERTDNHIRIATYNILCDSLLACSTQIDEKELADYPYLEWSIRKKKLLEELTEIDADIVAIQEFEKDEDIIKYMGHVGYDVKIFKIILVFI
jgi:mRNA deadenylase 3'-5' endonuclease subunit Ccr4